MNGGAWEQDRRSGHQILEHTADVGLRAWAPSLEECFEQATWALAAIIGIDRPGAGDAVELDLHAGDVEALLVDWLSEVVYLHDARDALVAGVDVRAVDPQRVRGDVSLAPRGEIPVDGTQVKAITYHRLRVQRAGDGFVAEVYVDV